MIPDILCFHHPLSVNNVTAGITPFPIQDTPIIDDLDIDVLADIP
jgi:hypothetical protein